MEPDDECVELDVHEVLDLCLQNTPASEEMFSKIWPSDTARHLLHKYEPFCYVFRRTKLYASLRVVTNVVVSSEIDRATGRRMIAFGAFLE